MHLSTSSLAETSDISIDYGTPSDLNYAGNDRVKITLID